MLKFEIKKDQFNIKVYNFKHLDSIKTFNFPEKMPPWDHF